MSDPPPPATDPSKGKAARNERRKAFATTLNAVGVAALIAAFVQPLVAGTATLLFSIAGVLVFIASQAALHYVLAKLED